MIPLRASYILYIFYENAEKEKDIDIILMAYIKNLHERNHFSNFSGMNKLYF
jgi:hypothetical protein